MIQIYFYHITLHCCFITLTDGKKVKKKKPDKDKDEPEKEKGKEKEPKKKTKSAKKIKGKSFRVFLVRVIKLQVTVLKLASLKTLGTSKILK